MEKLLELLNEYEEQKEKECGLRAYKRIHDGGWYLIQAINVVHKKEVPLALIEGRSLLISKQYRFIKRLVENDKIDLDKTGYKKADFQEVWNGDWRTVRGYEMLLMLLAIQERPIEFLISILK